MKAFKMNEDRETKKIFETKDPKVLKEYLGLIYSKYYKLVCFCISKYINNKETIEDLANDSFIKVFNNLDSLNDSIKYYLVVTANNTAKDYLKKKNSGLTDEKIILESDEPKYESYLNYLELLEDLKSVLSSFEVDLIIKHVLEGYTFKELAKLNNSKEKKISSIYFRALKKFIRTKGDDYL